MDDQIITRLNRAQAQMRDQFRIASSSAYSGGSSSNGNAQDAEAMCLQLWREMMSEQTLCRSRQDSVAEKGYSWLGPSTDHVIILHTDGQLVYRSEESRWAQWCR